MNSRMLPKFISLPCISGSFMGALTVRDKKPTSLSSAFLRFRQVLSDPHFVAQ